MAEKRTEKKMEQDNSREPIEISEDMLVSEDENDARTDFEKEMSYYPRLTLFLIAINIIVFVWQIISGALESQAAIISAGALYQVDSEGTGGTDHFVPVMGYDDRGADGLWYGAYNTWHEEETIDWYQFQGMSDNYTWGWDMPHLSGPVNPILFLLHPQLLFLSSPPCCLSELA